MGGRSGLLGKAKRGVITMLASGLGSAVALVKAGKNLAAPEMTTGDHIWAAFLLAAGLFALVLFAWMAYELGKDRTKKQRQVQEEQEAEEAAKIHREAQAEPQPRLWEIRKRAEARLKYDRCVGALHETLDPGEHDLP